MKSKHIKIEHENESDSDYTDQEIMFNHAQRSYDYHRENNV